MVISGGEANADMNDVWALNLHTKVWSQLEIEGVESFKPKRFHSASTISRNRFIAFGGCYGEYVHMNDVNLFDLDIFVQSEGVDRSATCVKLNQGEGTIPQTRWGHSASVYKDKLYILGGRNE